MTESCPKKTNIAEISPHLICALCGGYLIDATTIVECLHSFCKTCIVRYLESSKYCPICEVLVHKTRPLQNIRLDHTLQDIVYKLVPNLFKAEMKRRREFYKDHPTIRSAKVRQEQQRHRFIYSADEHFSISLEFCPDGCIRKPSARRSRKRSKQEGPERRYFLCPAGTTVGLLKKFMRLKFALADKFQVDIFHEKGPLKNHYSLMDVAYIYSWKREGVLQLYYSVFNLPDPVPTITITEVKTENCQEITDDTGQRLEDTRPSTLFNKATLLGNHSVDRNIPHDLSPLELIATVANDICIQEGRGIKRKAEDSQLYENDDDNSSTETNQLQKSIERAIDLCSYSNQGSPARAVVSNTVASSTAVVNTASSNSTVSVVQTASAVSDQNEQNINEIKNSNELSNGSAGSVTQIPSEKKTNNAKEKPKKTDTASQCDPRPKKLKSDGNSGGHSKSTHKAQSHNKDTKASSSVNKTDKSANSESRASNKHEPSKSNGVSIIEQNVATASAKQSKSAESSGNATKPEEPTTESSTLKDPLKDSTNGTKVSSESNRESSIVTKLLSSLPSTSVSVSKSNSVSSRQTGSSTKTSSSTTSGKSSSNNNNNNNNNNNKAPVSSVSIKTSNSQTKTLSGISQSTPMASPDKLSSGHTSSKVSANSSKVPSVSHSKPTNSPSKTNDSIKSSTLINGHSNPSEVAKQQTKNSSSTKVKTSDTKE